MRSEFVFNSESVTEGHPDKLCDQISDEIVGRYLRSDSSARVAAECCISTGILFVAVKFLSSAQLDISGISREVVRQAGYKGNGFDSASCTVLTSITEVSGESPVDETRLSDSEIDRMAAADQVTAFGYACNHTPVLMPLPIWLAHRLAHRLDQVRRDGTLPYLSPDGKVQVGVEFAGGKPRRIHSVTLTASQKHADSPKVRRFRDDLRQTVIEPTLAAEGWQVDVNTRVAINPQGPMIEGGPSKHSGLTGRKTGMDTYGEYARHSGAALSGKDPSRIDRSAAYAARYAAKNVVGAGLATHCEVLLSYSIGSSHPASIMVETYGTAKIPESEIARRLTRHFEFRPAGIVRALGLRELPRRLGTDFFRKLAVYGQVGRGDLDLPWERLDKVDDLREGLPASA